MNEKEKLCEKIYEVTSWKINPFRMKIVTDTSDWMRINRGDVIRLDDSDYVVRGNMREPRFGIDDQPKYWVFSAVELSTGKEKIIKTVFHEEFYAHIGILKIKCYRNPDKEGKVLDLVRNDDRFMQGYTVYDEKGNNVRVIDYIQGTSLFNYIPSINLTHEEYFYNVLPDIMHKLYESFLAILYLHQNGFCHGDIRNDHIFIETKSGKYRWIDFDLMQDVSDFDLWSFSNIIGYAVAKGIKTFDSVLKGNEFSDEIKNSLRREDGSAFYNYRILNLKKIYPYIPDHLDSILRHFTIKPDKYYRDSNEFCEDFKAMIDKEFPKTSNN